MFSLPPSHSLRSGVNSCVSPVSLILPRSGLISPLFGGPDTAVRAKRAITGVSPAQDATQEGGVEALWWRQSSFDLCDGHFVLGRGAE